MLGLERFGIPHAMGSSHGHTRIIRLAYYEDPSYVLLLRRAYELWREIQGKAGEKLLHITGSIDAGPEGILGLQGLVGVLQAPRPPHEVLTGAELGRRYPGYHLPPEHLALIQPEGGFLTPERCIVSYVMAAQSLGADIHGHERVLEWVPLEGGVRVRTDRGTYEADRLVMTAGAWNGDLLDVLDGLAVPERQVLAWLQPARPDLFRPDSFPVFNLLVDEGRFYGFPVFGVPGFKFGKYFHLGETGGADEIDRQPHDYDERLLRSFAERYFPDGCGPTMDLQTCMFTNTPDHHFVMDLHPDYPQVSIASPCSGHGFKFASVVGEIMADLAEKGVYPSRYLPLPPRPAKATGHRISVEPADQHRTTGGAVRRSSSLLHQDGRHKNVPGSRGLASRQQDAAGADHEPDNSEQTNTLSEHKVGPDHGGRGCEVDEAAHPGYAAQLQVQPIEAVTPERGEHDEPGDSTPEEQPARRLQPTPERCQRGEQQGACGALDPKHHVHRRLEAAPAKILPSLHQRGRHQASHPGKRHGVGPQRRLGNPYIAANHQRDPNEANGQSCPLPPVYALAQHGTSERSGQEGLEGRDESRGARGDAKLHSPDHTRQVYALGE